MNHDNLSHRYLRDTDLTLRHFDGDCHLLAFRVMSWLDSIGVRTEIVWVRHAMPTEYLAPTGRATGRTWRFHAAVEANGLVHDPWYDDPLPLTEWELVMFPGQLLFVVRGRPDLDELHRRVANPAYATP